MIDVHKVRIQVRAPRGNFGGEIAEGWYVVFENSVIMTDADGKPIDSEKHRLAPGDDPHIVAHRLLRQRRTSPRGFSDKIIYPRMGKI